MNDPQIAHRGALSEVSDGGGTFKVLNLPFRMSGSNVSAGRHIATLGEHTVALLQGGRAFGRRNSRLSGKIVSECADYCVPKVTHDEEASWTTSQHLALPEL